MQKLPFLVFQIVLGTYLTFVYPFFLIPYLAYILGKNSAQEKFLRTLAFLLTPFLLPLMAVLWVSWKLVQVLFSVFVIFVLAVISILLWLNGRFSTGKLITKWFNAANWIMRSVQDLMGLLGLKSGLS
jgi:hypothetical protein